MNTDEPQTTKQHEAIAAHLNEIGGDLGKRMMKHARGSPDIAMAILGVAVGHVLDQIDEDRRPQVLTDFIAAFEANEDA